MNRRASIFEPVDLSGIGPGIDEQRRPDQRVLDEIAKGSRFRSREPAPERPKREPHVYRTGRNVTFSAKTTQATVDAFYAIARERGWKAAETFEFAVAALRRELEALDSGES
jgi:hypothetical protein